MQVPEIKWIAGHGFWCCQTYNIVSLTFKIILWSVRCNSLPFPWQNKITRIINTLSKTIHFQGWVSNLGFHLNSVLDRTVLTITVRCKKYELYIGFIITVSSGPRGCDELGELDSVFVGSVCSFWLLCWEGASHTSARGRYLELLFFLFFDTSFSNLLKVFFFSFFFLLSTARNVRLIFISHLKRHHPWYLLLPYSLFCSSLMMLLKKATRTQEDRTSISLLSPCQSLGFLCFYWDEKRLRRLTQE